MDTSLWTRGYQFLIIIIVYLHVNELRKRVEMNINKGVEGVSQPSFKASLNKNELVKEMLNHVSKEDKESFDKALKTFAHVATDDVVELRKTEKDNTEEYSLVNTKNDKKKVFVCKMFPNASCEDDGPEEYRKHHFRLNYVFEALVDTLKEASNQYSNAFFDLFGDNKTNGKRQGDKN